jgi:uncharacterized protein (DUF58 family)
MTPAQRNSRGPFNPADISRLGGLALLAQRVMQGEISGSHRSPHKGYSIEFAEHRPYYPGDELRKIDWRAYGKTDRYFIKQYENETNLRAMILLDGSGSMAYRGRTGASKWLLAQQITACLAYLLLGQNDSVGLLLHTTEVQRTIPPRSAPRHLFAILQQAEQWQPQGPSGLGELWQTLAVSHFRRRGLVLILTDGHGNTDAMVRGLRYLHHSKQDVILLQILTREEVEFPFKEPTLFRDLEAHTQEISMDAKRLRAEYLANFQAHQSAIRRACSELRFRYQQALTTEPLTTLLGRLLQQS